VKENSVTHIDREAQYLVLTDFSDRSTCMMEFSVTLVTLGFFGWFFEEYLFKKYFFFIPSTLASSVINRVF
jgi:hypothetical protein